MAAFSALSCLEHPLGTFAAQLRQIAQRRHEALACGDVCRLSDMLGDELEAVTVERFGDYGLLNVYSEAGLALSEQLAPALLELGARGVYRKVHTRADLRKLARARYAPRTPLLGEAAPDEFVVTEHGLRFEVRLGDGLSTGLFIDQRDNRQLVRRLCAGAASCRALNLFCYTGSFSIAAGVGASLVTSVDLSSSVLRRCSRNIALNEQAPERHRLLRADAVKWLQRAVKREGQFELIVLDPPSFASQGKATFSVRRDYFALVVSCLRLLAPGGRLLAVTNHRGTHPDEFQGLLREAAQRAERVVAQLALLPPTSDCPVGAAPALATKSALVQISQ